MCHESSPCDHVCVLTLFACSTFLSLLTIFSLIILSFLLATNIIFHDVVDKFPVHSSANEDLGTLAEYDLLTGYEPNDYHISEAAEPYIEESSPRMTSSTMTSPSPRRSLHHCSPRSEKMMRGVDEPITLKTTSQSSSVSHDRTVRYVVKPFDSQIPNVREIPSHSSQSEQIRILLERQREQILAVCQAEIRKHEFQADYDRRSIQKIA